MIVKFWLHLLALTALLSTTATAQIAEVRAGITEFDEETTGINWGAGMGRENSIGINAEVIFAPVMGKDKSLRLHPYVGGMINLSGDTSYAAAGVMLRKDFTQKFYGDIGIGLAVHDGRIQLSDLPRAERRDAFLNGISFGSRFLFRPHLTLGYRIDEDWAGEIFMDHLSNGNVLDSTGINEGVDNLGIRFARRF